jgi:hypothetical protein
MRSLAFISLAWICSYGGLPMPNGICISNYNAREKPSPQQIGQLSSINTELKGTLPGNVACTDTVPAVETDPAVSCLNSVRQLWVTGQYWKLLLLAPR